MQYFSLNSVTVCRMGGTFGIIKAWGNLYCSSLTSCYAETVLFILFLAGPSCEDTKA